MDISYYFVKRKIKRIAFWGGNKFSLTVANILRHYDYIELLGIFDNKKNQEYIDNSLNYAIGVSLVDSLNDLRNIHPDIIIVTDWTMRHIGKVINFSKTVYLSELIRYKEFYLACNDSLFIQAKNEMKNRGVRYCSVKIPIEEELGIKKYNNKISLKERLSFFPKKLVFRLNQKRLKGSIMKEMNF